MPGIIALFESNADAEKAYLELGREMAGGYCLIKEDTEADRHGLQAALAGDQVVDSATVGLFTLNPGDHVTADPWDEEFGLEYSPGEPTRADEDHPLVMVKGEFPGLEDGGEERVDRVVARLPVPDSAREDLQRSLNEGKTVLWARAERAETGRVRSLIEPFGPQSIVEING